MTSHRSSGDDAAAAGAFHLGNDFGIAIGAVFRAYAKATEAAVADIPGGPRGYFVLTAAVQGEANNQRSLAERFGVDRTVMTYLLDDLERAGLVERRPDPADRRSRHIIATPHGAERWTELRGRVELVERHILAGLPEESRAGFQAMLCTLAGHVNAHGPMVDVCRIVADCTLAEEAERAALCDGRRATG
ncbi:MarR family winged helix-turn-helix transcriptional regulator [Streptomyces cadmiisoli]|uniref:MarR family winged helix-turn-helix transcriptional regulator n=1 Tax=Streptomyces cadmiisoli TaxID=2184053 RepID=UPI001FE7A0EA|nr:MarR family transcriptional regulator [Streptomyces cadmiisoli]